MIKVCFSDLIGWSMAYNIIFFFICNIYHKLFNTKQFIKSQIAIRLQTLTYVFYYLIHYVFIEFGC